MNWKFAEKSRNHYKGSVMDGWNAFAVRRLHLTDGKSVQLSGKVKKASDLREDEIEQRFKNGNDSNSHT